MLIMCKRNTIGVIVLLLSLAAEGRSTTLVVAITPSGTVVGTDSKFTVRTGAFGRTDKEGEGDKIVVVQDRIVVADVGIANISSSNGINVYNFLTWMNNLKNNLPDNISVDDFATIVEAESTNKFVSVPQMMQRGDIKREQPNELFRVFVQFVIAGYEAGVPKLYVVETDLDWNRIELIGPKKIPLDPSSQPGNIHFYFYGIKEVVADFADGESYAYKQTMMRTPKAFGDLTFNRAPVSLDETASIIRALVQIEKTTNPRDVGGSTHIFRVLPGRAYEEVDRVLPKTRTTEKQKKKPRQDDLHKNP
jgi:hypothetical protein